MSATIIGEWSTQEEVFHSFEIGNDYGHSHSPPPADRSGIELLFAHYSIDSYDGKAFVFFQKGEKLYAIHGAHCSCYGLEGQWEPVEVTKESILHEVNEGRLGQDYDPFAEQLLEVLGKL